jgi:hypothetical protein
MRIDEGRTVELGSKSFALFDLKGISLGVGRLRQPMKDTGGKELPFPDDAPITFQGAKSTFGPPIQRFLSASENWKEFYEVVLLPQLSVDSFAMSFPPLTIDHHLVVVPRIVFRRVTEDVCYVSV